MELKEYLLSCYSKEIALWLYELSKIKLTQEQIAKIEKDNREYCEQYVNANYKIE